MKDASNLITWVNGYQIFCWHHLIEVDVIDNIMLNYVYKKEYSKMSQSLDETIALTLVPNLGIEMVRYVVSNRWIYLWL